MSKEKSQDSAVPTSAVNDTVFYWGIRIALILIIVGMMMFIPYGRLPLFSGNDRNQKSMQEKLDCENAKTKMLRSARSYIEQEISSKHCLSGLVVLPPGINAQGYVPGDTEVYECRDEDPRSCSYKFTVPDTNGRYYKEAPMFPLRFRLKGKPGIAWFGRKPTENVRKTARKETRAEEVARLHREIKAMQREKELLEEKKRAENQKRKLEKKLAKLEKK
jgi:hypothetical protein